MGLGRHPLGPCAPSIELMIDYRGKTTPCRKQRYQNISDDQLAPRATEAELILRSLISDFVVIAIARPSRQTN